jgi:hypothetical protein
VLLKGTGMYVVNNQQAIQTLEMLMAPHYKVVNTFLAKYPESTPDPEALKMAREIKLIAACKSLMTYQKAIQGLKTQG